MFLKKQIINNKNKDVYLYGFEILISTLVYTLIFFFTALLTNTMLSSFVFWIGFYILRTLSGGYHAKSYLSCHVLFFINHIIFIITLYCIPNQYKALVAIIMIIISTLLVLLFSPVDHPNKPFINNEKQRFKILSNLYIIGVSIIFVVLYVISVELLINYSMSFAIGTLSAAISLLSAKIIYQKEGKKDEE